MYISIALPSFGPRSYSSFPPAGAEVGRWQFSYHNHTSGKLALPCIIYHSYILFAASSCYRSNWDFCFTWFHVLVRFRTRYESGLGSGNERGWNQTLNLSCDRRGILQTHPCNSNPKWNNFNDDGIKAGGQQLFCLYCSADPASIITNSLKPSCKRVVIKKNPNIYYEKLVK